MVLLNLVIVFNFNSCFYFLQVLKHCTLNRPNAGKLQAEITFTAGISDDNMLPASIQLLL
jgi:hypothetical protein